MVSSTPRTVGSGCVVLSYPTINACNTFRPFLTVVIFRFLFGEGGDFPETTIEAFFKGRILGKYELPK